MFAAVDYQLYLSTDARGEVIGETALDIDAGEIGGEVEGIDADRLSAVQLWAQRVPDGRALKQ